MKKLLASLLLCLSVHANAEVLATMPNNANGLMYFTDTHCPNKGDYWKIVFLVWIMILYVTMVYGPIAAFLVEMFPTKIRYTSMSLPYHIGNGVFGGLVPFLGTLIVEFTKSTAHPAGDVLAGLWYPIAVASICFIIGLVYLNNRIDKNVMD